MLKGTNQPKACKWKAPTDRSAAMIDPTPTVVPIPMSHTEAQTFLHRKPPRVLQAGPCPSSHMSGNGRSESVVHILHEAPTHRGKIARCRARSNKQTNQTTSWKPRNGRKRIPAPLGIWGGGGGSEDYPKAGKGGKGGRGWSGSGLMSGVAPCLQKTPVVEPRGMYLARLWCMLGWAAAATADAVAQTLLPVGGSVWFTLSWVVVMVVMVVVIVDIRGLAG